MKRTVKQSTSLQKSKKPSNVPPVLEVITIQRSEKIQARIDTAIEMYKDILLFTEFFIPHRKEVDGKYYQSPEFHQQIRDMIRPERSGNVVIVVPRLHGKTTAIKMYILWAICYKITDKIVYLANE